MYYENILDVIGNTPLVKINKLNPNPNLLLLAKLEFLNPGGSIKDRIASYLIDNAEKKNLIKKGGTIVEPTSGNTGAGLAMVAAIRGYKCVFIMPDKQSEDKRNLLRAFGAKVVVTPTAVTPDDERSYYMVSQKLTKEIVNSYKPDQYSNLNNPLAHYEKTGPEIWQQTEGKVTHVVIAMGTGGTISGVGKYLKQKNPKIKIIGVDPVGSIYYQYFKTKKIPKILTTYKVEGVGEDFMPDTMDFSIIDEIIKVSDKESFITARNLAHKEGILSGGSSGLALCGAIKYSRNIEKGIMVVILPDTGRNYLSKFYQNKWMINNGYLKKRRSKK
jgi:cystathionine beta-synthase